MRQSIAALLLLAGLGVAIYVGTRSAPRPQPESIPDAESALPSSAPRTPTTTLPVPEAPSSPGTLFAERRYENLLDGRRAGTIEVLWTRIPDPDRPGESLVRDVTSFRTRTARMMAGTRDLFESRTVSTTLRTEAGELLSMETVVTLPSRTDREAVRRTPTGYAVASEVGENSEQFEFETAGPAYVDAECFLGPRIRAGEAKAGAAYTYSILDARGRRLVDSSLRVIGEDPEGPGLKVVETLFDHDVLWWFDAEGAVVRQRSGDTVLQRRDALDPDDLGGRPASYAITLSTDVTLPRIFTTRAMEVELLVEVDETVRPPRIPENPFTETVAIGTDRVHLRLLTNDDETATTTLPIARGPFEEDLKATPLMEVDDPVVIAAARKATGGEKDARRAAVKIAEFVFSTLDKGSPDIAEPTARRILEERVGDCSEHALLFTTLCRAAGIPARRCSGYVNIGSDWGAHAWCEIWVGRWIGADPTTNEIGTRARYIFCGRPEDREMVPAVIRAGRTRIRTLKAEYVDGTLDFTGETPSEDPALFPEIFNGIRLGPLPPGWEVTHNSHGAEVRTPEGTIRAALAPDHGYRTARALHASESGADSESFGSRPALVQKRGSFRYWIVPLGRELLSVQWVPHNARSGGAPPAELPALFAPILER